MFRKGLLFTTALIIAASISVAAAQPAASDGIRMRDSVARRDANEEFLCNYGALSVSHVFTSYSGDTYSKWTHVAVPITGKGKTVQTIVVKEKLARYSSLETPMVSAGVYSNTASGLPGKQIAGGSAKIFNNCTKVKVSIPPTKLLKNTRYWIEETLPKPFSATNLATWQDDPHAKQHAYTQSHIYSSVYSVSSTTAWTMRAKGPWFRVR